MGRALTGRWSGTRFVLGPWPWMFLVSIQDGRASEAATGE